MSLRQEDGVLPPGVCSQAGDLSGHVHRRQLLVHLHSKKGACAMSELVFQSSPQSPPQTDASYREQI